MSGHAHVPWEILAFWAQLLNFVVLVALILWKAKGPLAGFLAGRRKQVESEIVEAKALHEKAAAVFKEYSDRLAKLDQEIGKLRAEMVKAGEEERERIILEAESKAARMRRDTQFIIEQQLKQLRVDLKHEAARAAIEAAEASLRQQLGETDQKRLAEEFVKGISSTREDLRSESPPTAQSPQGTV